MLKFCHAFMAAPSKKAPRNRTLELKPAEIDRLRSKVLPGRKAVESVNDRMICGDAFEVLPKLGKGRFDLLFADPPYNLTKDFGEEKFKIGRAHV